jgi:diguanylate cyclase (GGDEF)-like protein/PAS domain S-box-containing protein
VTLRAIRSVPLMVVLVFAVVIGIGVFAHREVRSIEEGLPARVGKEEAHIARMVQALSDLLRAVETARLKPTSERIEDVLERRDITLALLTEIRKTYTFDNLLHASALHATVSPALADVQRWLTEGIAGYGPTSDVVFRLVHQRIADAYAKAQGQYANSKRIAIHLLSEQARKLETLRTDIMIVLGGVAIFACWVIFLIFRERDAKAAMRESEQRFKDFASASSDWLWEMGPDLRFTFISDRFEEIAGVSAKDIVGKTGNEALWPRAAESEKSETTKWRQHWDDIKTRRGFRDLTYRWVTPDGRVVVQRNSGKPVFDADGSFLGYRGVGADITAEVEAREREADARQRFMNSIEAVSESFALFDADDRLVLCNSMFRRIQATPADKIVPGVPFEALLRENVAHGMFSEAIGREEAWIHDRMERHRNPSEPFIVPGKDGRTIQVREQRMADGSTYHVVTDISNLVKVQEALRESEERQRLLLESVGEAIYGLDTDGRCTFCNPACLRLLGYRDQQDLLGKKVHDLIHHTRADGSSYPENECHTVRAILEGEGVYADDELLWRADGTGFPAEYRAFPVKRGGVVVGAVVSFVDITERKRAEEQLVRQANFDNVTGLPNRMLAIDRLSQAMSRGRRRHRKTGILFVDLDRFKTINDTFGHEIGDRLLGRVGQRLSDCVREADTVARLGGDEFMIILPDLNTVAAAEIVAGKILAAFSEPFVVDDREIFVTSSVGITVSPDDGDDPQVLMRNADAAMYRVKDLGRNSFEFFTPALNEQIQKRVRIETRLHRALENDELSLVYQPVVDAQTGRLVGAEALLRWQNPVLGHVPPDDFIPLAEDSGQILSIGAWVLNAACRQAVAWQAGGKGLQRISVNVSSRQFRGGSLGSIVTSALDGSGLSPRALEIEITEGVLVEDRPEIGQTLARLRDLGVRIAVDDFGTRYSSLSYLRRFPVDTLKIDRSFIHDLLTDPDDANLVAAIIAMGHSLNLDIVAEGVETGEELRFLRSGDCDLVQGYLFSKPLSAADFARFVGDWESRALLAS